MEKPEKEDFGYIDNGTECFLPTDWTVPGGEAKYWAAHDKWADERAAERAAEHLADEGRRCENCRFWRDKSWDGDKGMGVCDCPKMVANVVSEVFLVRAFQLGDWGAAR